MIHPLLALLLGGTLAMAPAAGERTSEEIAVTGIVITNDGAPLAEARVELLPMPGSFEAGRLILTGRLEPPASVAATTDAAGRFALGAPRSGVWRVAVTAPGFVPMQLLPLPLVESRELPPVALRDDGGARVRVEDGGGHPLADAWVWADSADSRHWPRAEVWQPRFRAGRTDGQGRITLPRAAGEPLAIRILEAGAILAQRTSADAEVTIRVDHDALPRTVALAEPSSEAVLIRAGPLAWPAGLVEDGRPLRFATPDGSSLTLWLETAEGRRQAVEMPATAGREAPFTVTRPPSGVLIGRVLDATDRRPLAGALVWPGADPGAFVHADAEGRYRLAAPANGMFWIQAEAAGHRPQAVRITPEQVEAGQAPALALIAAAGVRGRVLDAAGTPLPEARLAAFPRRREATSQAAFRLDPAAGRARSGDGGAFVVGGLEPGRDYELRVSRPGHAAVRLDVTAPASRLVVRLARGRSAYGRVIDDEDRPVAGAAVTLTAAGEPPLPPGSAADGSEHRGTSDAEGRFVVPRVPAEEVEIAVLKEGFAPLVVRGVEIPPAGGDGGAVDLGTVVLAPGAVVAGRVVDPAGEPIADAPIFVLPPKFDPEAFTDPYGELLASRAPAARSDADGRFRLTEVSPGDRMHLFAGGVDHVGTWVQHLRVPLSEPLSIVLEPGLRVAGRVVDTSGAPIPGAELQLTWAERLTGLEAPAGRTGAKERRSDFEGRFAFGGLRPGPVTLDAWAPGFQEAEPLELEPRPGDESARREELEIVLERGATVRGEVKTAGGRLLDGVRVSAGRPGTFSDADGRFRLDGVAPGTVRVKAYHPHYGALQEEIEAEMGDNVVELTYPDGHQIRGRVVDESGRPLAGAALELDAAGRRGSPFYRARSDAEGLFTLAPVATGEYRLAADLPGWLLRTPTTVRVEGEDVDGLAVVLEPGAVVGGTVLGLDFDDLARLRVDAEDGRGASVHGRVDYTGAYEIRDLAPGDWVVRASLGGGRRQVEERLEIPPGGAEIRRDLRFVERFVLSGTVLLGGEPLPAARVSLAGRDLAVERQVATDHQGRFAIEDLEPATYNLGVAHGRELVVANRDVELDGNLDLVIDLQPARVSGRVVDAASGEPVAGALVVLVRLAESGEETNALSVASGERGDFDVPRAPPGTYRVSVQRDGYAAATWQLELAAGAARRDLELAVRPTPGAELRLLLADGGVPRSVDVTVLDAGNALLRESRPVDGDGRVALPRIPEGVYEVVLRSPGTAPRHATLAVPGDPLTLVLEPAGSLEVRVPDLVTSNAVASLELLGPDGRPFVSLDPYGRPAGTWRVVGGRATVEGVPAGAWSLRVTSARGQTWSATVETVAGTHAFVELR